MMRLAILALCLVACGGAQHAASPQLAIADLEIYEGDEAVIHLLANGELQVLAKGEQNGTKYEEWRTVGQLAADGKIVAAGGKTSRLAADGTLPGSGLRITADALVATGWRITIDPRGAVLIDGKPFGRDKLVRVAGVTAATRRTALLVLALTIGDPTRGV